MKRIKLFEEFILEKEMNEIVDLVHVYDKNGELFGTGELVKTKGKKSLIRWDGSNEEWIDSNLVKMVESAVSEKREDVGKYNTVKKVIAKLGRRPSEQELATFINNNYYDVTEVERGDDDPAANDKIADLVAFYKFDIDDWEIAWFDAQNESIVTEEAVEVTPDSKVVVDDYTLDDAETEIKSTEIIGAIVSANSEDEFLDHFYKEYGNSAFTENDISTLISYYQEYREEVNAEETEAEGEAEGGDEKDPLADLGI